MSKPVIHHPAIATILLLGGMVFLAGGLITLPGAIRSSGWPSVEGRITEYHTGTVYRAKHIRPKFAVCVRYQYRVAGVSYVGSEYSHATTPIGPGHDSEREAIAEYLHDPAFAKWQVGQPVAVFYDPRKPSDAVLKAGVTWFGWVLCGIGILISAIGFREFILIKRLRASGSARSAQLT